MSRRKEKTVPINKDTVMNLYHIQIGENLQQKDLADDLNCTKEHLNRVLSKGEGAESFRDKIARYLGVHPELLGKQYEDTIIWEDWLTGEKKEVAPEDVQTYKLYETTNRIKDEAHKILNRVTAPTSAYISAAGLNDKFNSYDKHQQLFISAMMQDYIDQLFTAAETIPRERYVEYQDWHRETVKEYLSK